MRSTATLVVLSGLAALALACGGEPAPPAADEAVPEAPPPGAAATGGPIGSAKAEFGGTRLWMSGRTADADALPRAGESVLALCGKALVEGSAKVLPRPPGSDEDVSPPVQGPCDAPFLLVRAGALRPGPAVTVATSGALLDGPVALEGLGAASSLRAERIGEAMGYRVVLDGADGAWTLVEHAETDDGQPTLLWAGDLDGDGRLDLLLNQTPKYSYQLVGLYLSSAATEGPVALVDEITVVTD